MRKLIKLIPLFLTFSFGFALISCANLAGSSGSSESKTVVFHGSFSIDEAFVSQNSDSVMPARSAQPTIPADTNLTYYAKATNGTVTINSEDLNDSTGTFSIPLKTGSTWTIEVGAKGTSTVNNNNVVLIKDTKVFNPANDEPTKDYKFYLTPQITDGGTGKLNLRIKIQDPSGNKISKVEIVPKKCLNKPNDTAAVTAGWQDLGTSIWTSGAATYTSSLDNFTISKASFKSGIWEVAVNFKDSQDQLLYSSVQIICVYDHLETKTWESSKTVADSNDLIVSTGTDSGVMYLTTLLVDAYGLTDFYVNKNGSHDDADNGSPMKPFGTIKKAIAVVNGLGRLDKTYTIHVKEGSNPTLETYETIDETISITSNLSIECYKTTPGDRLGNVIIASTNSNGPIIQIGNGITVASLTIDGIKNTDTTPTNYSDDTWTGLQLVSNRSSNGINTRGVEIKTNGSLFMNGGSITGNISNSAGAGVYISENGYFIFTGGRITGNNSGTNSGGGIYVASGGDLLMKGGIVTGNTGSTGAGIYPAGNITIGGTCYISGNTSNSAASNLYLPNDKLIRITGTINGSTIGITTQSTPSVGNNIRFTDGYAYAKEWGQNGNNHPYKYFNSDRTGFSILTDPTPNDPTTPEDENNGDAYLGVSGGLITKYVIPTITISFTKNSNTEYVISATCSEDGWTGPDSTNTNVTLQNNGVDIPAALWSYSHDTHKLTLQSALPKGNYVIQVDVTYAGYCYTGTYKLTKS